MTVRRTGLLWLDIKVSVSGLEVEAFLLRHKDQNCFRSFKEKKQISYDCRK